jgi:hypothetical protein
VSYVSRYYVQLVQKKWRALIMRNKDQSANDERFGPAMEAGSSLVYVLATSIVGGLSGEIGAEILKSAGHEGYDDAQYAANGFAGGAVMGLMIATLWQCFTCGNGAAAYFSAAGNAKENSDNDNLLKTIVQMAVFATLSGMLGHSMHGGESSLAGNHTLTVKKQAAASATGSPFAAICTSLIFVVVGICCAAPLLQAAQKSDEHRYAAQLGVFARSSQPHTAASNCADSVNDDSAQAQVTTV